MALRLTETEAIYGGSVPGTIKRYKYCEYLGKLFCPCCHGNETALIPARILHKWDFDK